MTEKADIVERLRLIPETVSTAGKGGVHCPVGKWCHEARNEILCLRKEGEKYRRISELKSHAIDRYIPCPDHRDKRNRDDECEMCRRERAERRATRAEAEVERLNSRLSWRSSNPEAIHYPECWRDHYDCAQARVEELKSALAQIAGDNWSNHEIDSPGADTAAQIIVEMRRIARAALSSTERHPGGGGKE